jgi:hypothetical protein
MDAIVVSPLLFRLEVVEEDRPLLRLLAPVLNHNARAVHHLPGIALPIQHACKRLLEEPIHLPYAVWQVLLQTPGLWERLTETSPLAQLLAVRDLDQGDLVLGAECDDELLICLLLASLVEYAHVCLASVQRLGRFPETAGETVVHEGELENSFQGVENGHLALGAIGADFDSIPNLGSVRLFYVRL